MRVIDRKSGNTAMFGFRLVHRPPHLDAHVIILVTGRDGDGKGAAKQGRMGWVKKELSVNTMFFQ